MSHGAVIDTARIAVEEALRQVVKAPARDGQSMARDAKVIRELARAHTHLEQARQALIEHGT